MIGVGENANGANAQTTANLLGKLLRIRADGTIPTDNPFYGTASGQNRAIWALGLRNPFTFAVEPGSGRIFINDVGQSSWEEIDDGAAGANYGWPDTEGYTTDARYQTPRYAYGHGGTTPSGCAITGGTFYRPAVANFPAAYVGTYFFSDLCGGWIYGLDPAGTGDPQQLSSGINGPVDLKVGPDGALYYLAHYGGTVGRISYGP
jgi:glucose/arabinose dehydrogenase